VKAYRGFESHPVRQFLLILLGKISVLGFVPITAHR
jgi:hypothetical protein